MRLFRRRRLWRNATIAVGVAILCFAASLTSGVRVVDRKIFDVLSTLAPAAPDHPGAVIVAIDEPSFAEIGQRWPWPRSLHARLIRALREAGAATIGLDLLFAEPSGDDGDRELAAALDDRTVLAADVETIALEQGLQVSRVEPTDALRATGARLGVTTLDLDRDNLIRRMPIAPDAFARQMLTGDETRGAASERLIQFFGGARSYPTVAYYQALDPQRFLPKDFFRDKIVFVGFSLKASPRAGSAASDAFATPFTWREGTLTAGVEIHATILDNLKHRLAVLEAPVWASTGFLALIVALASFVGSPAAPLRFAATAAATLMATAALSWIGLRFGRVFVSPLMPGLAGAACYGLRFIVAYVRERRLRQRISTAFSRYVAPELVAELVRDPAALRLGGERRELTILFCDVRGFTSLSERLKDDPERLTSIVNRLLDGLSEQVLQTRGTIDKYMGDCVMAFWNAPLRVDDHASRALAAASAMRGVVERVNRELLAEDPHHEALTVGIGINTGVCVVGNMGSRWRYDYSVLGDAVNLASRLEGLTKELGVAVVIGERTAAIVEGRAPLRAVAEIAVRGRSEKTRVYTFDETGPSMA